MEYFSFCPSDFFCKQISVVIIVTVYGFIGKFEVLTLVWLKIECDALLLGERFLNVLKEKDGSPAFLQNVRKR